MSAALAIPTQIILGWIFADFLSGILHFVQDRGLLPNFLDKHIGVPNRLHHSDPLAITRDPSLLNRNWTTWATVVPISLAIFAITGASALDGGIMAAAWFWETNDINRLADTPGVADETRRINGGQNGIADRTAKFNELVDEMLRRGRGK